MPKLQVRIIDAAMACSALADKVTVGHTSPRRAAEHAFSPEVSTVMSKTLPDQIADLLIALIFTGDITPGSKLPPERQLAEYLDVDRTSLRMALRTLGRMNAVSSVQGSGIRVGDVHKDMGLDFLDNLYRIPELELGGNLLLAGLELFNRAIPTAIRMALETHRQQGNPQRYQRIPELVHAMYAALSQQQSMAELAALEVDLIDTVIGATGNLVLQASATSSRRIRLMLTTRLYEIINVREHLDYQVRMLSMTLQQELDMSGFVGEYQRYIDTITLPLFRHLQSISPHPRLIRSPLHNGRNIMSLKPLLGMAVQS